MASTVPRRRELIAYFAGLTAIAGLMTVVALGGWHSTAKRPAVDAAPSHVTASKQP